MSGKIDKAGANESLNALEVDVSIFTERIQ